MGDNSKIQWTTGQTFNPWIGCTKIDALCQNCYAEKFAERYGYAKWGEKGVRHKTSAANWKKPYAWNRKAQKEGVRYRVFCASLSDVFDDHESIKQEWRDELFTIIKNTPNLDWLLLTKRPENYIKFLPQDWGHGYPNVWLGVSVGDKLGAVQRLDLLVSTPAAIRFISAEPLVERFPIPDEGIDWIICGGESGTLNKIRQLDLFDVKGLIDFCKRKGVKFFFKQLGSILSKKYNLQDGHGGTFEQYPAGLEWLKIREIPDSHPSFITIPEPEDIQDEPLKLDI